MTLTMTVTGIGLLVSFCRLACVGLYLQVRVSFAFVARELLPCLLCPSNYALSGRGGGGKLPWTERRLH